MVPTTVRKTSVPVATVVSMTVMTPLMPATMTVLAPGLYPSSTWRDSQGLRSSFSAKQKLYLPGVDSVALSISPGTRPPRLRITKRRARPMDALALYPGPKQPLSSFIPSYPAKGPLAMMIRAAPPVVTDTPATLNSSASTASTAATTTGKYSGRQPAMTELIATFSRVTRAFRG